MGDKAQRHVAGLGLVQVCSRPLVFWPMEKSRYEIVVGRGHPANAWPLCARNCCARRGVGRRQRRCRVCQGVGPVEDQEISRSPGGAGVEDEEESIERARSVLSGRCLPGLKDWSCAEEHYETALELDPKLPTADLAKTRLKKSKVWRLLGEAKATIADSKAPSDKMKQAQHTLDVVSKLGLDDEQQAVYQQLQAKLPQGKSTTSEPGKQKVTGKDGAPMALVPDGEFAMGSDLVDDEKPQHRVYLNAFYMDTYEVTVGQYAKFLEAPPDWNIMNQARHQKRPVANVDWADAATYCKWAGKRLPTEAEWEKAARGTDGRTYPWGNEVRTRLHATFGKLDTSKDDLGWNSHAALTPVGLLEDGKSPYGIYDMAGNVWEWTSDWYDKNYYQSSPSQNPEGPSSGEFKVIRGGSWFNDPQALRSALRGNDKPSYRLHNSGSAARRLPELLVLGPWILV